MPRRRSTRTISTRPARAPATMTAARTLGPLPTLEPHLASDWWRTIFGATYLQTDGDVVENAANTARDVDQLVHAAGLGPDSHILDLCCGQGRHCLELARRGHRYVTGLDRSRYLVGLARRRAIAAGLEASFHEGDARNLRLREAPFDAVAMLGNSFGYFEKADDDVAVLASVRASLRPGGVLALDVSDGAWIRANFEPRSWEWIDRQRLVCREREVSRDGTRLVCREVVVHATRGVVTDQFYAQRLYDRASLGELLERAGFGDVTEHDAYASESDRNEDLGMMERCVFLTARPASSASLVVPRVAPRPALDVLVLLGDPRRPEPLRPGAQFTPEDGDALVRLRGALAESTECAFRYHDEHATLLATLAARRPALVLNFCDEGFGNDLASELHVPALLDVLGIAYSGAGPACLGLCADKSHARAIAAALGVPVPREVCVGPECALDGIDVVYPAIVKPRVGDGSLGIDQRSVVRDREAMLACVRDSRAKRPENSVLVQEFLEGTEYSVGLLGNPATGLDVLPVLEVDYSALPSGLPRILGYESKWNHPPSPYWTDVHYRRAALPAEAHARLVAAARLLFAEFGCRDYARLDFRCGADGVPRFLEINPNPGWGWGDELNYMADWAGLSYPQLLARIVDAARARLGHA